MISELFFDRWRSQSSEPNQQIEQDVPDYKEILEQIKGSAKELSFQIEDCGKLMSEQSQPQTELSSIAGYFKAKNACMVQYLILLHAYQLQKISKGTIDSMLVDRLLEQKILIGKISNTQKKLQYQVDKILQLGERQQPAEEENSQPPDQEEDSEDQLAQMAFKPRPEMLTSQMQHAEETGQKPQKYVPPKLAATLQKEDMNIEKRRKLDERRKEYLKTKLYKTLVDDRDDDAPLVLDKDQYDEIYLGQKQTKADSRRVEVEEDQFHRLQVTKQEKRRKKQVEKLRQQDEKIDNLADLKDVNTLLRMEGLVDDLEEPGERQPPKQKKKGKQGIKKKKFYKFKKHK